MCDLGTRWDQQLPEAMLKKGNRWNNNLQSEKMVVPRAFRVEQEKIKAIDFYIFSDASIIGTARLCMQLFTSHQEHCKD